MSDEMANITAISEPAPAGNQAAAVDLGMTLRERREQYGDPRHEFERVAAMWGVILGAPVKSEHVPLCMIALKIVRETHSHKEDNLLDIAGYAQCALDVHSAREERTVQ